MVAEEAGSAGPQVVSAGSELDAAANSRALMWTPKLQQTGVFLWFILFFLFLFSSHSFLSLFLFSLVTAAADVAATGGVSATAIATRYAYFLIAYSFYSYLSYSSLF